MPIPYSYWQTMSILFYRKTQKDRTIHILSLRLYRKFPLLCDLWKYSPFKPFPYIIKPGYIPSSSSFL